MYQKFNTQRRMRSPPLRGRMHFEDLVKDVGVSKTANIPNQAAVRGNFDIDDFGNMDSDEDDFQPNRTTVSPTLPTKPQYNLVPYGFLREEDDALEEEEDYDGVPVDESVIASLRHLHPQQNVLCQKDTPIRVNALNRNIQKSTGELSRSESWRRASPLQLEGFGSSQEAPNSHLISEYVSPHTKQRWDEKPRLNAPSYNHMASIVCPPSNSQFIATAKVRENTFNVAPAPLASPAALISPKVMSSAPTNNALVPTLPIPDGSGTIKYPAPDINSFVFDPVTGYRFDKSSGLHYDANSGYFFNNVLKIYLHWDKFLHTYFKIDNPIGVTGLPGAQSTTLVQASAIISSSTAQSPTSFLPSDFSKKSFFEHNTAPNIVPVDRSVEKCITAYPLKNQIATSKSLNAPNSITTVSSASNFPPPSEPRVFNRIAPNNSTSCEQKAQSSLNVVETSFFNKVRKAKLAAAHLKPTSRTRRWGSPDPLLVAAQELAKQTDPKGPSLGPETLEIGVVQKRTEKTPSEVGILDLKEILMRSRQFMKEKITSENTANTKLIAPSESQTDQDSTARRREKQGRGSQRNNSCPRSSENIMTFNERPLIKKKRCSSPPHPERSDKGCKLRGRNPTMNRRRAASPRSFQEKRHEQCTNSPVPRSRRNNLSPDVSRRSGSKGGSHERKHEKSSTSPYREGRRNNSNPAMKRRRSSSREKRLERKREKCTSSSNFKDERINSSPTIMTRRSVSPQSCENRHKQSSKSPSRRGRRTDSSPSVIRRRSGSKGSSLERRHKKSPNPVERKNNLSPPVKRKQPSSLGSSQEITQEKPSNSPGDRRISSQKAQKKPVVHERRTPEQVVTVVLDRSPGGSNVKIHEDERNLHRKLDHSKERKSDPTQRDNDKVPEQSSVSSTAKSSSTELPNSDKSKEEDKKRRVWERLGRAPPLKRNDSKSSDSSQARKKNHDSSSNRRIPVKERLGRVSGDKEVDAISSKNGLGNDMNSSKVGLGSEEDSEECGRTNQRLVNERKFSGTLGTSITEIDFKKGFDLTPISKLEILDSMEENKDISDEVVSKGNDEVEVETSEFDFLNEALDDDNESTIVDEYEEILDYEDINMDDSEDLMKIPPTDESISTAEGIEDKHAATIPYAEPTNESSVTVASENQNGIINIPRPCSEDNESKSTGHCEDPEANNRLVEDQGKTEKIIGDESVTTVDWDEETICENNTIVKKESNLHTFLEQLNSQKIASALEAAEPGQSANESVADNPVEPSSTDELHSANLTSGEDLRGNDSISQLDKGSGLVDNVPELRFVNGESAQAIITQVPEEGVSVVEASTCNTTLDDKSAEERISRDSEKELVGKTNLMTTSAVLSNVQEINASCSAPHANFGKWCESVSTQSPPKSGSEPLSGNDDKSTKPSTTPDFQEDGSVFIGLYKTSEENDIPSTSTAEIKKPAELTDIPSTSNAEMKTSAEQNDSHESQVIGSICSMVAESVESTVTEATNRTNETITKFAGNTNVDDGRLVSNEDIITVSVIGGKKPTNQLNDKKCDYAAEVEGKQLSSFNSNDQSLNATHSQTDKCVTGRNETDNLNDEVPTGPHYLQRSVSDIETFLLLSSQKVEIQNQEYHYSTNDVDQKKKVFSRLGEKIPSNPSTSLSMVNDASEEPLSNSAGKPLALDNISDLLQPVSHDVEDIGHLFDCQPTSVVLIGPLNFIEPLPNFIRFTHSYMCTALRREKVPFLKVNVFDEKKTGAPYPYILVTFCSPSAASVWYEKHNGRYKCDQKIFREVKGHIQHKCLPNAEASLHFTSNNWVCQSCKKSNFPLRSLCCGCFQHCNGKYGFTPLKILNQLHSFNKMTNFVGVLASKFPITRDPVLDSLPPLTGFNILRAETIIDEKTGFPAGIHVFEMPSTIEAGKLKKYLTNRKIEAVSVDVYNKELWKPPEEVLQGIPAKVSDDHELHQFPQKYDGEENTSRSRLTADQPSSSWSPRGHSLGSSRACGSKLDRYEHCPPRINSPRFELRDVESLPPSALLPEDVDCHHSGRRDLDVRNSRIPANRSCQVRDLSHDSQLLRRREPGQSISPWEDPYFRPARQFSPERYPSPPPNFRVSPIQEAFPSRHFSPERRYSSPPPRCLSPRRGIRPGYSRSPVREIRNARRISPWQDRPPLEVRPPPRRNFSPPRDVSPRRDRGFSPVRRRSPHRDIDIRSRLGSPPRRNLSPLRYRSRSPHQLPIEFRSRTPVSGPPPKPDGLSDWRYPPPDPRNFKYEPLSGLDYDPVTKLYYEPKSCCFFNDDTNDWLEYDVRTGQYNVVRNHRRAP